jgi:hypothetical protein
MCEGHNQPADRNHPGSSNHIFPLVAPPIALHITEVESYSRNVKNAFTFRKKGRSYSRGVNQEKFGRSFSRPFRLRGVHLQGGFSKRGFTVYLQLFRIMIQQGVLEIRRDVVSTIP